ncbi:MAG: trypsin-like peptidase domain-containing protein [Synergistaceae bacterium]|nr:trypsin-like peptidase domain-containing protein [Synergistaceae bacterium]
MADETIPIDKMKSSVGLVVRVADIQDRNTGEVNKNVPLGTGSCFMVGNGDCAITNCHVIATNDLQSIMQAYAINISNVQFYVIFFDSSGRQIGEFITNVIDYNAAKDLALITLPAEIANAGVEPVKFLKDSQIKVLMDVYAVGFPFTDLGKEMVKDHTVTKGVVSKVNAEANGRYCVQTDASINPGNSGGALYDKHGNLIGVNTCGVNHSIGEGINFAVQSGEVISFLNANHIPVAFADDNTDACGNSGGNNTEDSMNSEVQPVSANSWKSSTDGILVVLVVACILLAISVGVYITKVKGKNNSVSLAGHRPQSNSGNLLANSLPRQRVPQGGVRVADGVFTLTGVQGSFTGMNIPFHSFPASIGRDTAVCKVQFAPNTKGVSRLHCTISFNAGVFTVTDSSTYGTYVNGSKIAPNVPTRLSNGDKLACAGEVFRVTIRQ